MKPLPQLFELGRIVATPGAIALMEDTQTLPVHLLARHICGDWGDLDEHDKRENNFAHDKPLRILSAYPLGTGRVWVITEADRSATTILLPEEY